MRKSFILLISVSLLLHGCASNNIVESAPVATSSNAIIEERVRLEPIIAYGAELQLGETVTQDAIEMIYDFYVSKETYHKDVSKTLYTYSDYVENFQDYADSVDENNPSEYEYSWFLLMGGQKQTGEYVGFTLYNPSNETIKVQDGVLTNFYAILDEYSNISYDGLKYGSTPEEMIKIIGDYDSYFENDSEDDDYDEEYNYNYNDGQTYLTFRYKDKKLVSILAADIVDTKAAIMRYEESFK